MWKTLHTCKQWQFQVREDSCDYRIVNLGSDGSRQFYQAFSGQYGEPLLEPEPDLAVEPPFGCIYKNATEEIVIPDQKISGIICRDESGAVVLRVSLTNARNKNIPWSLDQNGALTVDEKIFYLYALVQKDKNRIRNYDAFFASSPPSDGNVVVYELEDLVKSSV